MSEPTEERSDEIDRALRRVQEEERAEQRSDLERQQQFDDGIAHALSERESS